jgi:hypothetical protein
VFDIIFRLLLIGQKSKGDTFFEFFFFIKGAGAWDE